MLRALTNLRVGARIIAKDALVPERTFGAAVRASLIAKGRLAPVQGPLLAVVPQFAPYAAILAEHGIETVGALLDAETGACADLPLESLQAQALELVKPVCRHCGG
ncbi:MAG: hypothetical protein BWY63_00800 [Chloroflexi bacterium ADurb.Bin360]|nr:MAG: hypothetical protein BWY63_00800 [Chloroflexi bacterium ADurb.Bin360]